MMVTKISIFFAFIICTHASPVSSDLEESSDFEEDPISYVHDTVIEFIHSLLDQESNQNAEGVEVNRNKLVETSPEENESRAGGNYEEKIEKYFKTQDLHVPFVGKIRIESDNFENDEVGLKIKFGENNVNEARKSKLKKILTPILVFVLLKAITVVPLVLGVLLLKAASSLQLSIFAFVISSALAIFQLCRKIAENNAHAQITANGPWENQQTVVKQRSFDNADYVHNLVYSAYRK